MQTPYQILNISSTATDAEIKQAYLQQVKNNPPERDQQLFQLIHQAYLAIKDHKSRLNYELFTVPETNFDDIINQALGSEPNKALTAEQFNAMLTASIDDSTLHNSLSTPDKP